jgi:hypothetical protein
MKGNFSALRVKRIREKPKNDPPYCILPFSRFYLCQYIATPGLSKRNHNFANGKSLLSKLQFPLFLPPGSCHAKQSLIPVELYVLCRQKYHLNYPNYYLFTSLPIVFNAVHKSKI